MENICTFYSVNDTVNMSLPCSSNALLSSLLILLDILRTFLQEHFDDIFVSSSQ